MAPEGCTSPVQFGNTSVVASSWEMMAGPAKRSPAPNVARLKSGTCAVPEAKCTGRRPSSHCAGAGGQNRPGRRGHAAGRFHPQGHELHRRIEREAVEALMRRRKGGFDLACIIDPADGDFTALAVIAQQGDRALLPVAGRHLLGGEPIVGLASELGMDRARG